MHPPKIANVCKSAQMDAHQREAKEFVRRLLDVTGEDLTALARGAGLAPSTLTRPYNDQTGRFKFTLSQRSISKLEQRWGVPFRSEAALKIKRMTAPIVGYVGGGEQVFPVDEGPNGSGLDEVDLPPGADPKSVAVRVRGDSMFPAFWDGDVLIYSKTQGFDRQSSLYNECVVKIKNGAVYVKRLTPGSQPGRFTLESYNAPPIIDVLVEWAAPVEFRDQRMRRPRKQKTK